MSGRITDIEAIEVCVPLPQPLQIGSMVVPDRRYCIVRVSDGEGRFGVAHGLTRNAPVAQTIAQTISASWVDKPLDDYDDVYRASVRSNVCLGTNGIFWRALSLCDCAVHDLLAQRAGIPLGEFLGGKRRSVKKLLVGGYPATDETAASLADQMQSLKTLRPDGVKIAGSGDLYRDTERLAACRAALDDDTPLMIDLFWQVSDTQAACDAMRGWRDLGIGWVEDPVAFDDYEGLEQLATQTELPFAMGDEQSGDRAFERLAREGRVSTLRLDATVCGGVRAFLRIASMAQSRGLNVACHMADQLHLQLAAAAPNVEWIEQMPEHLGLDAAHLLWEDAGDRGGPTGRRGVPGVGIVWDWDAVERFRVPASCLLSI